MNRHSVAENFLSMKESLLAVQVAHQFQPSKLIPTIPDGSCVLTLLPDRGDRYLDLVYEDEWFEMIKKRHFNRNLRRQENLTLQNVV